MSTKTSHIKKQKLTLPINILTHPPPQAHRAPRSTQPPPQPGTKLKQPHRHTKTNKLYDTSSYLKSSLKPREDLPHPANNHNQQRATYKHKAQHPRIPKLQTNTATAQPNKNIESRYETKLSHIRHYKYLD